MKPFLILQLRPEDKASDNEFEAFLKFGDLKKEEVVRVRMEKGNFPEVNLEDFSGVIVGGGPYNVSDSEDKKSPEQKNAEIKLKGILDVVVEKDIPYLGACYGLGILGKHQGCEVSKDKYSEEVGAVTIKLTEEGKKDELLRELPAEFRAFVGHKEACQEVPKSAVLLASSDTCPIQMIRIKDNIYATQFHPELDAEGIIVRVNVYKGYGYFPPEEGERIIDLARKEKLTVPMEILRRFVAKYK